MKCNICGQEFGSGAYCQHCKADRITALGNYTGYTSPNAAAKATNSGSAVNASSTTYPMKQYDKNNFIVCYNCANVIPADSEYCPCCNTKLFKTCPKCGHKYSSQYKYCNKCGINREEYLKQQDELKRRQQEEEERKRQYREKVKAQELEDENYKLIAKIIVFIICLLLSFGGVLCVFADKLRWWLIIPMGVILAIILFHYLWNDN